MRSSNRSPYFSNLLSQVDISNPMSRFSRVSRHWAYNWMHAFMMGRWSSRVLSLTCCFRRDRLPNGSIHWFFR